MLSRCECPLLSACLRWFLWSRLERRNPTRKPDPIARFRSIVLPTSCRCRESCGTSRDRAVPGVHLDLRNDSGAHYETLTGAEGIFRLRDVRLGIYEAHAGQAGFQDAWPLNDWN